MRYFAAIAFALLLFSSGRQAGRKGAEHYMDFKDSEALAGFLRYDGNAPVIIQGHRGTRENGLPESSVAAFEYVLEHTPAIFEIDPRLTKDSVIVVFHDSTLDRTTNGVGKVADHTWAELQRLNLKNARGEVTPYKIPALSEVLKWARGKTALILDKKDVPPRMIADMIRECDAAGYVLNMVRTPDEALFYYRDDPGRVLSVSVRTPEAFTSYMDAGIPPGRMFACVGTEINDTTVEMCRMMRSKGIRSLMATGTTYDKLKTPGERAKAYRMVAESGVTIIESNYPAEVAKALRTPDSR